MLEALTPSMRRLTSCAHRPAQLTTNRNRTTAGSASPAVSSTLRSQARPERTGADSAICAPRASASRRSAIISAWLSTMPVDGEKRPPAQDTSGSSALTSLAESITRSCTPLASAEVLSAVSTGISCALVATISLPTRACGISRSAQYA